MNVRTYDPTRKYICVLVNSKEVDRNALLVRRIPGVDWVSSYTNGMLSIYVEGRDFDEVLRDIQSFQEEGS